MDGDVKYLHFFDQSISINLDISKLYNAFILKF